MSDPSPTSPRRRPRLSLQIKAITSDPTLRSSRVLAAAVNVKDRTTFNTLSNVYAAAIQRSTPTREKPPATVSTPVTRPSLRLQTQDAIQHNTKLQSPYVGPYLDTPLSAQPTSPVIAMEMRFPSAMTATPPLSAGPVDPATSSFTFNAQAAEDKASPDTPSTLKQPRHTTMLPASLLRAPYSHPDALHSILRNSPLPPATRQPSASPISPRRQSLRLAEKAARRVAYNSPLCQTITTSRYTRSHMDLLAGSESPYTPDDVSSVDGTSSSESNLDAAVTAAAMRDGGDTPGLFEEMRRRVAAATPGTSEASSPLSPSAGGGIQKRGAGRRREKKRRWVWTIGEAAADAYADVDSPADDRQGGGKTPKAAAAAAVAAAVSAATSSPRPRTRLQASREASASPAALADIAPIHAVSVPVIAIPAPRPRTRRQAALQAPVPSAPLTAAVVAPILDDTPMRDVHDEYISAADVVRSDVSSFASRADVQPKACRVAGEDDMDMDTPTTPARPVH